MNPDNYISDITPLAAGERHDVLASHAVVGAHRPLTCRWPSERPPVGTVVFCHGLGSDGSQYAALSRHWARHGYLVVHPTFSDSIKVVVRTEPNLDLDSTDDLSGWTAMPVVRARMHEILHTPAYWLQRIEIVRAIMDSMSEIVAATAGATTSPVPCAIAGHSFGAFTAQLFAGAEINLPNGETGRFRDPRFAAAILLSAQGRDQQGLCESSWSAIDGPVLTVTGTLDQGAKGGDWRWKSEPFDFSPTGGKYLMVLEDGDHFLGGFDDGAGQRQVPAQRDALEQMTLAFLDAYLRRNPASRAWLGTVSQTVAGCRLLFKSK